MDKANEIKFEEQFTLHLVLARYDFPDVEKMAAVFSLTKTPLAVGRADSNALDLVNPAFAELHGYTVEELRGTPMLAICAPEVRGRVMEDVNRVNELGHLIYETKHVKKNGTVFPVQIDATAVRDEKRNLLFRIITVHDITTRKQAEGKINSLMDELRRSNQDLDQFSTALAHDLKSPLIAVSGCARRLLERYADRMDKSGKEYMAMIRESAERMLRLVGELRDYAKIGAEPKELKGVEMDEVIRQAVDNLRADIEAYKVNIRVDLMPVVSGDEVQLIQLVQNLISNSINYRRAEEPLDISVSCEQSGNEWVFRFKDNGIGIESPQFEKIFLMFQRGMAPRGEGMGFGLAICKRIVERHGGRIWVNALPGKGTSFYFSIPAREDNP